MSSVISSTHCFHRHDDDFDDDGVFYEGRVTKGFVQLSCTGSRYQSKHETFYDDDDNDNDDSDDDDDDDYDDDDDDYDDDDDDDH